MGTSATALIVTCLLLVPWTCASGSTVAEYTIDLDLPPNKRYDSFVKNYNKTVWQFYEDYFAKDKLLTNALYLIVDERGSEPPEMQGEIEGLATASKLPLKFVQGIQMLYELQTLMVPIENGAFSVVLAAFAI